MLGAEKMPTSKERLDYIESWKKDNTDYETQCRRNKEIWSLPHENSAHDEELMNEINELFYNC